MTPPCDFDFANHFCRAYYISTGFKLNALRFDSFFFFLLNDITLDVIGMLISYLLFEKLLCAYIFGRKSTSFGPMRHCDL